MYILGRVNYLQRKVLEVIGKNVIENQILPTNRIHVQSGQEKLLLKTINIPVCLTFHSRA